MFMGTPFALSGVPLDIRKGDYMNKEYEVIYCIHDGFELLPLFTIHEGDLADCLAYSKMYQSVNADIMYAEGAELIVRRK